LAVASATPAAGPGDAGPGWRETLAAARASFDVAAVEEGATYRLPYKYIFYGSEAVSVGDAAWERGRDYRLDYDAGTLTVLAPPPYAGPLRVTYEYLPFLQGDDFRAALESENEAEELERLEEAASSPSQLDVAGSKTFTVRAGSAEGADFDQSLRLSIRGQVGEVKITGEITDQNLPLDEGGTTEDVEAVDKISMRVEGKHFAGTFGDYDTEISGRRFADYERRLTGIMAEAFYPEWEASAYGARARGRFATNEFYGVDGVQGPYRLTARDDDDILVLPGTETVWFNGVEMAPGENADYVMDYDLATLTFTVRRPVSAEDRIVVDFQYSTEEYQRNFYGGTALGRFARDTITVDALYVHEEDDRDSDFFGLTQEQRDVLLPLVGDDPERGRVVVVDENGNVIYEYVGEGQGEYVRQWDPILGVYVYTYVGAGNGDYMPRTILLPLPKRQSLFDFSTTFAPTRLITVEAEGATSDLDANTFSPLGDDDNTGLAGALDTTIRLDALELFRPLGELTVGHRIETRDTHFRNLGREDDVSFLRDWDLEDEVVGLTRPPGYNLHETTVTESPVRSLSFSGTYGSIHQRYVGLSATGYMYHRGERRAAAFDWTPERLPHVTYDFNYVRRRGQRGAAAFEYGDEAFINFLTYDEHTRREQTGKISYSFWRLRPYVRVYDKKRRGDYRVDGTPDTGTIDRELGFGTGVTPAAGWDVNLGYTGGRGEEVEELAFAPSYRSHREHASCTYDNPGLLNARGEYTKTKKDFYAADTLDTYSDLSLLEAYYTPLERALGIRTRYELNNLQEYEREEVFEVAADRDGDYRREPDPRNPNRFIYVYDPDDPDAIYVKTYRYTGRAFPVLEPDLTVNVDVRPYRFNDVRSDAANRNPWLDAAAADLYLHARNSSSSPRRFAVAVLQDLLGEDALDSDLEQRYTLTILPINRRLTGRLRYTIKDSLLRTVAAREERDWRTSRYGEVVGEPVARLTVQADVERVREWESVVEENVSGAAVTRATEMIYGVEPTYNLTTRLDVKARAELSRRREDFNGAATDIDGTKVKPEATYRLTESGTVNTWYERTSYDVSGYGGSETLLSRTPGVTHKWEASVNKGVGKYVTLIFTYDGERRPDEEDTEHSGQVDLNIYF
jgi:hypothetical protein